MEEVACNQGSKTQKILNSIKIATNFDNSLSEHRTSVWTKLRLSTFGLIVNNNNDDYLYLGFQPFVYLVFSGL